MAHVGCTVSFRRTVCIFIISMSSQITESSRLIVARSLLRLRQHSIRVSRIIAKSRVSDKFAAANGVDDYFNRAERAVTLLVGRVVADNVLRAQVFGDLGGDGWNLADVFREI